MLKATLFFFLETLGMQYVEETNSRLSQGPASEYYAQLAYAGSTKN